MIYYNTGTGNTRWVAEQLGKALGEPTMAIDHQLLSLDTIDTAHTEGQRLIFVQPVHSWGPALMTTRLIKRIVKTHADAWAVMVCGDNCGDSDKIMSRALRKKGIRLRGTYSVQMPNNYVLMKGFGTDTPELQKQKIAAAPERIKAIAEAIMEGRDGEGLYVRGTKSWLKSGIVYPLFAHLAVKQVKFYATDACTGCGTCQRVCPLRNIEMKDKRPVWGKDCTQCSACIHHCPIHAIEYGKASIGQGRYVFGSIGEKD